MTTSPSSTDFTTGSFAAEDGTRIGFRRKGAGRPIVVVHGSISTGELYLPFADRLAEHYAVYVLDRRGRGLSGDAPSYTLATEAADAAALIAHAAQESGAVPVLFGHSYGATCALETVRRGAQVDALVLFEPPLPFDGPVAGQHLNDYAAAIAADDRDRAMRIASEHFLRISAEETDQLAATPLWQQFLALAPTWTRELAEIDATDSLLPEYGALAVQTLLLIGEASPGHLISSSQSLAARLGDATTTVLPGQNHFAHVSDPDSLASAVHSYLVNRLGPVGHLS